MNSDVRYRAYFECINDECREVHELDEIVYKCGACGSLLQVTHDPDQLKSKSPGEWKELFATRWMRNDWPYGSGVWGKKEWVLPDIENENVVSLYEGGTNLLWAERFAKSIGISDLWVKQCGNMHTGSFKDLGMTVLVSQVNNMISKGRKIQAVACASTGDTSASLASYCATAGIQSIVFLPNNKVSTAQLIQPISNGALVLSLDTDFDGCMEIVKEVCKDNNIYLANSMNSLRIEGQKTIAVELVQQFDWEVPEWVIIPGGNLGNVSALGKGFEMMFELGLINRMPRIVLAQAENANPLYRSYLKDFKEFEPVHAEKTYASAIQIGNPVSVEKAIRTMKKFNGIVEHATEDELSNAAARADMTGMYNCPHTGVALAVLIKLVERKEIKKNERVILISTAHGLKFTEFKISYHENRMEGVDPRYRNQPVELAPDVDDVKRAIHDRLKAGINAGPSFL